MFPYYRRGVELVSRLFCESNAVAYPTSSERWIEATLEFPPAPTGLMAPILPYPVEYRMADLFFWQKKYPEALKACDAALQKFPNLDCIIKLKEDIEKKLKE